MAIERPAVGHWYRRTNGNLLKIVAVDDEDGTIEVQFFDGTIDEVEFDIWYGLLLEPVDAPEDWSGSVDMDPEDFSGVDGGEMPPGYHDPLSFLDRGD